MTQARQAVRQRWLWAEFVLLFLVAPAFIALFLPATTMFPALFALTALGLWLLSRTEGFSWRELLRGRVDGRVVAAMAVVTAVFGGAVVMATNPGQLFALARANPGLLAMILLLYPVLSALPQELLFRPLFFRRYGPILPAGRVAVLLNATIFSFAHLMYWSWIVAGMTFAGGLAFAWAYHMRGSFPLAVVLHAVAGGIVFTLGLGMFFYSGNVVRPF